MIMWIFIIRNNAFTPHQCRWQTNGSYVVLVSSTTKCVHIRIYFWFLSHSGFSTPTIEDSMAMVGVALVLYGLIKFISWTFTSSGSKLSRNTILKKKAATNSHSTSRVKKQTKFKVLNKEYRIHEVRIKFGLLFYFIQSRVKLRNQKR